MGGFKLQLFYSLLQLTNVSQENLSFCPLSLFGLTFLLPYSRTRGRPLEPSEYAGHLHHRALRRVHRHDDVARVLRRRQLARLHAGKWTRLLQGSSRTKETAGLSPRRVPGHGIPGLKIHPSFRSGRQVFSLSSYYYDDLLLLVYWQNGSKNNRN